MLRRPSSLPHSFLFYLYFLSLSFGLCDGRSYCNHTISRNAIHALAHIIREYYLPNTQDFVVTLHAQRSDARQKMDELLSCVLPYIDDVKVVIETLEGERRPTHTRKFNLLLVDGLAALQALHPASLTLNYDVNEFYLLALIEPDPLSHTSQLIEDLLQYFWSHYLINVSLLYERTANLVELYTFFPFLRHHSCREGNVLKINSYITGAWLYDSGKHIFPEKLVDLQNCTLKVAVWHTPPYLSFYPHKHGNAQLSDFEGDLLMELAQKLNFSMELLVPPHNEQRGMRFRNGTLTGAMQMLQSRTADLSLGCFRYSLERCEVLTAALPYYQTWQSFGVLLTAHRYTSLEILAFAFDNNTWLCLLLSLQMILLLAYALYRQSHYSLLAHIMVGFPRPRTPLINILGTFFGISVLHEPRTNFARFVLIMWFIYGHVMRAAYQSLLYQLLQTEKYRAPPKTLDGLIANNYALIMTEGTRLTLDSVPQIHKGHISVILSNSSLEDEIYAMVEESQQRLAGVSPQDFLTYYVIQHKRRGIFYVLPEKIFAQHNTMYFTKHSFLIERFNQLLMQLRGHGLIEYWAQKYLDFRSFQRREPIRNNQLSMSDLLGMFVIYFVLIKITIVVFFMELFWHRISVG